MHLLTLFGVDNFGFICYVAFKISFLMETRLLSYRLVQSKLRLGLDRVTATALSLSSTHLVGMALIAHLLCQSATVSKIVRSLVL